MLFAIILVLPLLNEAIHFVDFERKKENRTFRDSLIVDVNNLDAFPKETEEYINDNFSLRSPLLSIYHHIKYFGFGVSPDREKMIFGEDGWYFLAEKELAIAEGRLNFSDEQLQEFETEWRSRKDYFNEKGIKFYWLITPTKHAIYPDKLPFKTSEINKPKRKLQLKNKLNECVGDFIVDPTENLVKSKDDKVFYMFDNHWNDLAGLIATNALLDRISKDFPKLNEQANLDLRWFDSIHHDGIHYNILGIDELYENARHALILNEAGIEGGSYGFKSPDWFPYPREYERTFQNKANIPGLRVLIIRDSFGQCLMKYIKESFAESVFIFDGWHYDLHPEIIDIVKPDIVIFQTLETNLESIIAEGRDEN